MSSNKCVGEEGRQRRGMQRFLSFKDSYPYVKLIKTVPSVVAALTVYDTQARERRRIVISFFLQFKSSNIAANSARARVTIGFTILL